MQKNGENTFLYYSLHPSCYFSIHPVLHFEDLVFLILWILNILADKLTLLYKLAYVHSLNYSYIA